MSAATEDRVNTPSRLGNQFALPVKAATIIYGATLVARAVSTGYMEPAADTAGLIVEGVARAQVDNSAGAAGDLDVEVKRGCFLFDLDGDNEPTAADFGKLVYVLDDQTISTDPGDNNIIAGIFRGLEDDQGWVEVGGSPIPLTNPVDHIADASVAHALNSTFSDTEVEGALDALGGKINAILAVLETNGLTLDA